MQYVNPNYHAWSCLSLINIVANTDLINNVFVGIDKIDTENLYVLINNDGTSSTLQYIKDLMNSENYISYIIPDVDLILLKFKVTDKKTYSQLLNGDYDKINKEFHKNADSFIADCVRTSRQGYLPFFRMLFFILDNNPRLIDEYWKVLYPDDEWLVNEIINSEKYFSAVSPNSNNILTNFYSNTLKSEYEISIE